MNFIDYEMSQNLSHGITIDGFNSTRIGSTAKPKKVYFTVTNHNKYYYEDGYKKEVSRNVNYNKQGQAYYRYNGYAYDITSII